MTASAPVTSKNRWLALAVLCVANFLILLDTTIVNNAVPNIMSSLDAGIDSALWVLNGYLLAFASLLIIFGRLGDVVGPRRMFVIGLAVFTVASLLCGLSDTAGLLIASRILQGIGAAILVPQALVLITGIFPPEKRGAAFGIFTAVAGIASMSGPTLGGFLVTELSWRWIFYVNLPVGVLGIVFALRFVPDLRLGRPHRFDIVGVLLATLGLVGVVFGLIEGQRHNWGTVAGPITITGIFVVSAVLLLAFLFWERRQPEPLLPMDLFRRRNFTIAATVTLVVSFALYGFLVVFAIETQSALGMSPLKSGITALPLTIALSAVAPIAGRLADRVGGRILLVIGLALFGAGLLGVAFIPTTSSTSLTFMLPLIVVGVGMGITIAPAVTEAMREVASDQAGAASGVLNTARQVGAALGAAVLGAVLQSQLASGKGVIAAGRPTLAVAAGVVLFGCLLAMFMVRHKATVRATSGDRAAAKINV